MRTGFVPMAFMNSTTAGLNIESRSKTRYRGVERLQASMMDALGCLFSWGDGAGALLKQQGK